MKKKIEDLIEESKLFDFSDGYLGSMNHGVPYYNNYNNIEDIDEIKSESNLMSLVLDKERGDEELDNWDEFWDKWFKDCDEYEIIEDGINGGLGYGKIVVDKINKSIKIMIVPCLYSDYNSKKDSDIKIFGFDYNSGKLIREIDKDKLSEILKDKDYYIG